MKKLTIYWPSSINQSDMRKIRQRFGITAGTTINGETPAEIKDEDLPLLDETARRGYISIRGYKPELEGLFNIKVQEPCFIARMEKRNTQTKLSMWPTLKSTGQALSSRDTQE